MNIVERCCKILTLSEIFYMCHFSQLLVLYCNQRRLLKAEDTVNTLKANVALILKTINSR